MEEEFDVGEMLDDEKERGSGDKAQVITEIFGELHREGRLLDRIALVLIAQGKRRSQMRLGGSSGESLRKTRIFPGKKNPLL
jgi:hypothetical protein